MLVPVIKNKITLKTAESKQQTEQTEILSQPEPPPATPPKTLEEKPTVTVQTPPPKTPEKEPEKAPPVKEPDKKPQTEKPAESAKLPATPVSTPPVQTPQPPAKPVETRDWSIYLIGANNNLVKVNRSFKVSDTTLRNSINALLAGPTPDEIMRGIDSFIPEGSRLLSASVENSTAYLSFNQEFRYNPKGREGCVASIKQIVWTATEFSNIQNVQFLIEGETVDFLSEGVPIRTPIGR